MAPNKSTTGLRKNVAQASKGVTPPTQRKMGGSKNQMKPQKNAPLAPFRGVSEVSVAPVNLGNSLRSVKPIVTAKPGSVTVCGRDFVMPIDGIGTGDSGWEFSGGVPLTPAALVASVLRGYFSSYQQYRFNRVVAHYISSSPTSLAGDIMFMYHTNRAGPKVNKSSSNFMSYVLSNPSSLLGPQWSNHSTEIDISGDWTPTDIFDAEDVQHQSDGDLIVYTRNTTNGSSPDSPGYLVLDYECEFRHQMTNPRILTLPTSLMKWFAVGLRTNVISPTARDPLIFTNFSSDKPDQVTTTLPAGDVRGNIYQLVVNADNSFNPNGLNFATAFGTKSDDGGSFAASLGNFPLDISGITLYGVSGPFPTLTLYPNYDAALAGRPIVWLIGAVNVTVGMSFNCSLVGSVGSSFLQSNIG